MRIVGILFAKTNLAESVELSRLILRFLRLSTSVSSSSEEYRLKRENEKRVKGGRYKVRSFNFNRQIPSSNLGCLDVSYTFGCAAHRDRLNSTESLSNSRQRGVVMRS